MTDRNNRQDHNNRESQQGDLTAVVTTEKGGWKGSKPIWLLSLEKNGSVRLLLCLYCFLMRAGQWQSFNLFLFYTEKIFIHEHNHLCGHAT